jgi:hypothetical protein
MIPHCDFDLHFSAVKITILLQVTYRPNAFPIKILLTFFTEIEKITILKIIWNYKRLRLEASQYLTSKHTTKL